METSTNLLDSGPTSLAAPPPAVVSAALRRLPLRSLRRAANRLGIGPVERTALGVWLLSRLGVLVITWCVSWTLLSEHVLVPRSWAGLWQHWDWLRYYGIAADGYSLSAQHGSSIAFFPGLPITLRLVHYVLPNWVYAGLFISLIAGSVATVAMARITMLETTAAGLAPGSDRAAVRDTMLFLVCAPAAIFLAAGYTESLFLAFALTGWLAARRARWLTCGVLLACASAVRINGLFEIVAVGVVFLQSRPGRRDWLRGTAALVISLIPTAVFTTYLHARTGSWLAWKHAEDGEWKRSVTNPVATLAHTWRYAFGHEFSADISWEYQLELLAVAVGLVVVGWLVYRRRWPEVVYVGLSLGALMASYVYMSVPREMLLWWPMWAGLGVWTTRRPWVRTGYLLVSVPLMLTIAYRFFTGEWAG